MRKAITGSNKLTAPEGKAMGALNDLGLPYLFRKEIDGYVVDLLVPSLNLIVEVDGDYWHSRPEDTGRDSGRDSHMLALGYQTVRITETDLNANALGAVTAALEMSGRTI
jgi:very-short-patch-repair endonuclease